MFKNLMNNYYYGKSGKGDYRKEDLPHNRWQLFWEMLRVRFTGICRINLTCFVVFIPALIAVVMFVNAFIGVSSIERVTDEATGTSMMMAVYDAPVDEEGNVTGEGATVALAALLQSFCVTLIPGLLIVGPAQAGMAYVTRNWARDEHAFPWADFWDAVKGNWKQALGISAITSVLPIIAYTCFRFYGEMSSSSSMLFMIPQMLVLMLAFVWWLALVFFYPMMVTYRMTFVQLIKNGLLLTVARLPMVIGIRLATLVPVLIVAVLTLFTGAGVYALLGLAIYYILMGNAFARFVDASFTNAVFDRYINVKIPGAKINRGLASDEEDEGSEEGQDPDEPSGRDGEAR